MRTDFEVKPSSRKDYAITYEDWLQDGETLVSSAWTAPAGVTASNDSINASPVQLEIDNAGTTRTFPAGTVAIVWLEIDAQVSVGDVLDVVNTIETDSAPVTRKDSRTIRLKVVQRYTP